MRLFKFPKEFFTFNRRHNLTWLHLNCASPAGKVSDNEDLIIRNTVISTDHLTPELKLRLITPECELWRAKSTESVFPSDPFWGIYWPGGQVLGRYILDNKKFFNGKKVLDIGSGSGACALAAAKSGASFVLANDIDPFSLSAIHINARLNNLMVHTIGDNIIGEDIDSLVLKVSSEEMCLKWNVVLIGDMFYDIDFSTKLFAWLIELVKMGKVVLVGDPGRHVLKDLDAMKDSGELVKMADYDLINEQHNGFRQGLVFREQFPVTLVFRLSTGACAVPTGHYTLLKCAQAAQHLDPWWVKALEQLTGHKAGSMSGI